MNANATGDSSNRDRQTSGGIGLDYDLLPYFRPGDEADPVLQPGFIMALSRLYGGTGHASRVLDLGNGSGALLDRVANATAADVVGIDISVVACNEARLRLAPLGERATVHCADLLVLDPASIGQFDAIFVVGLAYCVPPAVTDRVYAFVRSCLRPGGVVVIGHYAGARAALNDVLFATVRDHVTADLPPAKTIAQARQLLMQVDARIPATAETTLIKHLIAQAIARPDEPLYHEVLNPNWRPIATTEISRALAPAGIGFACSLDGMHLQQFAIASDRIASTDWGDVVSGGHRYSLFVKWTDREKPDPWTASVLWHSTLVKAAGPAERYLDTRSGRPFDLHQPLTRAFAEATSVAPIALDAVEPLQALNIQNRDWLTADILAMVAAGVTRPICDVEDR